MNCSRLNDVIETLQETTFCIETVLKMLAMIWKLLLDLCVVLVMDVCLFRISSAVNTRDAMVYGREGLCIVVEQLQTVERVVNWCEMSDIKTVWCVFCFLTPFCGYGMSYK